MKVSTGRKILKLLEFTDFQIEKLVHGNLDDEVSDDLIISVVDVKIKQNKADQQALFRMLADAVEKGRKSILS